LFHPKPLKGLKEIKMNINDNVSNANQSLFKVPFRGLGVEMCSKLIDE
jgi:hypothetical protein